MQIKLNPWVKTTIIATVGGGISAAVAAAMDPNKWKFPQDMGSGKLWPFFFTGALTVGGAVLIKSPMGQTVLASFKDSQQALKDSKQTVAETKDSIKPK